MWFPVMVDCDRGLFGVVHDGLIGVVGHNWHNCED